MSLPQNFLGDGEPERIAIKGEFAVQVIVEKPNRPDAFHLERAAQQNTTHIVFRLAEVEVAVAGVDVHAALHRVHHLLGLGYVRQIRGALIAALVGHLGF